MRTVLSPVRPARAAALLVGLFIALSGMRAAEAQRATRTTSKSGVTTSTWKAKGTTFRTESQKMHGKTVHWERATTGKNGVTKLRGQTWGSSYSGYEVANAAGTLREVHVKGSDGTTRKVTTVTDPKGTTRTLITGLPGGQSRRMTRWNLGKTTMTETTDVGASGKVISRKRTGSKTE